MTSKLFHRCLFRAIPLAAATALLLAGCGTPRDTYVDRSVNDLYNTGVDQLEQENYKAAAKVFDEVERQHPYSAWATKAQLMSGFAYYQANSYDDAIVALDRFIQLHPGNKDIAYAYYLKSLCYYERISDVSRDQSTTQRALDSLQEVVRRYPDTAYARDARLKIDLTRDHLAGKEMEVGRFYLSRGENLAAVNRFRRVVDEYQTTTQVPEALHRLVEAYLRLGMKEEAGKAASVLGHNYPGSEWYSDSYALLTEPRQQARGFWERLYN